MNNQLCILTIVFFSCNLLNAQKDSSSLKKDDIQLKSSIVQHDKNMFIVQPPTNLLASDGTHKDGIFLEWKNNNEGNKYLVYRGYSSSDIKEMRLQTSSSGIPNLNYMDLADLIPSHLYYYRVKTVNKNNFVSSFSKPDSGFVHSFTFNTTPFPIYPVENSKTNNNVITFKWASVNKADKYRLQVVNLDFDKWNSLTGYTYHPNKILDIELTENEYSFNIDTQKQYSWTLQAIKNTEKTNFSNYQRFYFQNQSNITSTIETNLQLKNFPTSNQKINNSYIYIPLTINSLSKKIIKSIQISSFLSNDEILDKNDIQIGTYHRSILKIENDKFFTLVTDIRDIPKGQYYLILTINAEKTKGNTISFFFSQN